MHGEKRLLVTEVARTETLNGDATTMTTRPRKWSRGTGGRGTVSPTRSRVGEDGKERLVFDQVEAREGGMGGVQPPGTSRCRCSTDMESIERSLFR